MKLKNLFVSLLAVLVAAVACDELNNLDETITSELTELAFATAGGAETISFVAPAAWTAEVTEGAEWIKIDPTSGEGSTEAQSISVTVDENPDTLAREGEITITMGAADPLAIPVTQAAGAKEDEPIVSVETWGLVGTMTNWGDPTEDGTVMSDIAMIADGSYYAAMGVTLTTADEFKFRTNNTWGTERTTSVNPVTPDAEYEAVEGNGNIKVSADGTYDIYLTVALDKFYVMNEGKTPEQAGEPEPVEDVWQLIGVNGDWTTPVDMNQTDGILEGDWWVASGVAFTEGVYFKIFANNSWSDDAKNIGFVTEEQVNSGAALNVAIPVGTKTTALANGLWDSSDIWLTEGAGGVYDVWFNVTDMIVHVMTEGYKPGDTPVVTPVEPEPLDVTIKEFLVAEVSDSVLYRVSGTIVNIQEVSDTYQNATFTISDDTDELYVYRMSLADTTERIANLGLTVGDFITVKGYRGEYASKPQLTKGTYVYHEDREAPVVEPTVATVAEFLAAEVSDAVVYRVTGTIVDMSEINEQYQNVNLTISDETGEVYIYRMKAAENGTALADLGLTVGDLLTIDGNRAEYQGNAQMTNGRYVSHEDREALVDYSGTYFINASGNIAEPLPESYNYGYLYADRAWSGAGIASTEANQFTFSAVDGGYTMQDLSGRYYYMKGTYNSFNVATELPAEGGIWTIEENESGEYIIMNVLVQKYIQYSTSYASYGAYSTESGLLPTLVKAENFVPAVSLSTASVSFDADGGTATVEVLNADGVTVSAKADTTAFTVNVESNLISIETFKAEAAWSFVIPVQFEYNGFISSSNITISQSAPVVEGDGNYYIVTFDFTDATSTASLPSGSSNAQKDKAEYMIGDYALSFESTGGYYLNTGYMFVKSTGKVYLPAIDGKKLVKAELSNSTNTSTSLQVGIYTEDASAAVAGGESQTWSTTSSTYTYNLTGTENNTTYILYNTNKNAQYSKIVLYYE